MSKTHFRTATSATKEGKVYTRCGRFVPEAKAAKNKAEVTYFSCLESHSAPVRRAMRRA